MELFAEFSDQEEDNSSPHLLPPEAQLALERKYRVFQQLTERIPLELGKQLSKQDRKQLAAAIPVDFTLTYGEVDFHALGEVLWSIQNKYGTLPPNAVFYDLGSGTGKGVLAAALLHDFAECKGVEMLSSLYSASEELRMKYEANFPAAQAQDPELWGSCPQLTFIHSDIFAHEFTDADVIFLNCACFGQQMIDQIGRANFRTGTFAVTTGNRIQGESWVLLEKTPRKMSWGTTDVYIQRRVRPPSEEDSLDSNKSV